MFKRDDLLSIHWDDDVSRNALHETHTMAPTLIDGDNDDRHDDGRCGLASLIELVIHYLAR